MTQVLLYDCPSCTASCSVAPDLVGLNVVWPNWTREFTATPPESAADLQLPDAIPFFKSGKLEILKNHLDKLISDEDLSKLFPPLRTGLFSLGQKCQFRPFSLGFNHC